MTTNLTRREMVSAAALGALAIGRPKNLWAAAVRAQNPSRAASNSPHRAGATAKFRSPTVRRGEGDGSFRDRPAPAARLERRARPRAHVSMGYTNDRKDFLSNGFTTRASHPMLLAELESGIPAAKARGRSQRHRDVRQSKGKERRRWYRGGDRRTEENCAARRAGGRNGLRGAAELEGGPPRLSGRPHLVRRGSHEGRRHRRG